MTPMLFNLLLLFSVIESSLATEIDVNGIQSDDFLANGSLDDAQRFVQIEGQVMTALLKLDTQLGQALKQLSSASGDVEIDVVVGDATPTGSGLEIDDEIVVVIPAGSGSRLSEEEKLELKDEIESDVAGVLDAMIVDQALAPATAEPELGLTEGSFVDKVEALFEEEAEAEQELEKMKEDLEHVLGSLPDDSRSMEIDIVVTDSDDENQVELVEDEIVVVISPSSGSGPRLTEEEKHLLEEEVVGHAADALGAIVLRDFVRNIATATTEPPETAAQLQLPDDPRLEEKSPEEDTLQQRVAAPMTKEKADEAAWADAVPNPEPKPVFRSGIATAIAQPGFEHPMFIPHHWQTSDEQLWTMKLSMLTAVSCVTLLLIVGVWTGVRRSRRHAILDDSHFRWAETVEYMDAFPYDP
ncbi:unnamed protein product [Phytophthora fragariaefolia]|uniref:Unnamed protein product n=1 Tax=Phytophthora fragariaefolia TaxID=1490495 RepID=A0A9W6XUR7_9STRA|nr:unnamed protein product [Phytophthora fragariaefolia]